MGPTLERCPRLGIKNVFGVKKGVAAFVRFVLNQESKGNEGDFSKSDGVA